MVGRASVALILVKQLTSFTTKTGHQLKTKFWLPSAGSARLSCVVCINLGPLGESVSDDLGKIDKIVRSFDNYLVIERPD